VKRSGFSRPAPKPAKQMDSYTVKPRTPALRRDDGKARMSVPIPKERPARDEAYRRLVAALPCAHCGRPGPSQVCHVDQGKGMGIKTSDYDTWPGCADALFRQGCHSIIGSSGRLSRDERRALEREYAAKTRETLKAAV
jgi:hypothetical protein